MGLFESHVPIDSITVMVQKEVADSSCSQVPGTKDYGAFHIAVAVLCRTICGSEMCRQTALCQDQKYGFCRSIRLTKYKDAPIKVTNEKFNSS